MTSYTAIRRSSLTRLVLLIPFLVLLGCGAELDVPQPGQPAPDEPLPDPTPPTEPAPPEAAAVTVSESTVAPGEFVTVRARGFTPNTTVDVGIGLPRSEYDVVTQAQTDAEGRLETQVEVPDWTNRGDPYVMVVTEPDHDPREVSDPFVVAAPGDRVEVHGELTDEGVECPTLRGPFGTLYSLATTGLEFGPGTQVTVEGTVAAASICMQGTTIEVESIERH